MELEKQLYNFFLDFWRLVKKYAKQPSSAEAWDELLRESDELNRKHDRGNAEGRFYKNCILAWYEYLQDREQTGEGHHPLNATRTNENRPN